MRITFLEALAEAKEQNGEGQKAKIIKQLKKTEEQRELFRGLKPLSKKFGQNLATTSVIVTLPGGLKAEITDKEGMVRAIIKENKQKYHQCEDSCPFLQYPLIEEFGAYGNTENIEKVLKGEYECPPDTDEFTKLFITLCKQQAHTTSMKRSVKQFKHSWKKMKEKTGTHDIHFGHFIASCQHEHNLLVHFIMAEIPFRSGFAPTRWKEATNVMILKKSGMFDIDKLRTLCLFQSDFNHNNKFLGRSMMNHIVTNSYVAKEQYSISGKKCITQALNKTLVFDIARQQKGSLCLTSCDLKSCYDRIAHTPAMMACRSYGCPVEPLVSFFATLQDVQYQTQTVYGKSAQTFGGLEPGFNCKPQGAGQGNGAAPQLWAVLSSKMFEMLHSLQLGNIMHTPISNSELVLVGFAYVDDSDLFSYSANHDSEHTVRKMQQIISSWEKSAKVTGGALAPSKCWWYMVEFEWDTECNWYYVQHDTNSMIHELVARDAENVPTKLQYLPPSCAQEMLGVQIAPDGNNEAQVKHLLSKAQQSAEIIRSSNVMQHEAWIGLTCMAIKKLEYVLPATTLSEEECYKITRPLIDSFLPKAGINRNIRYDVLFGSVQARGLGLKSLFLTQGIAHISELLENVWKDSVTGHFMITSLEYLRLELGTNAHILHSSYEQHKHLILTPSWITNTWEFMDRFDIKVDINPSKIMEVRENDMPIMLALKNTNLFSNKDLALINKCRIYLKAFLLSDIVTGDGNRISHNAWNGIPSNVRAKIQWPNMSPPSPSMWKLWKEALHKGLCKERIMILSTPLRRWYQIPKYWKYFQHDTTGDLYSFNDASRLCVHRTVHGRGRTRIFTSQPSVITGETMASLRPTTVYKDAAEHLHSEGAFTIKTNMVSPSVPQTNSHEKWLFYEITDNDTNALIHAIKTGTAVAVCDGSYYESSGYGTAAWCLTDSTNELIVKGSSIVPGEESVQCSFRSEMVGILAILTYLDTLHNQLDEHLTTNKVHLVCDNESVLQIFSEWSTDRMTPRHKNADVISAVLKLRDKLKITFTVEHVYGHQDSITHIDNLPPIVRLNIAMDEQAKSLALRMINGKTERFSVVDHYASFHMCRWNQLYIHQQLTDTLYHHISLQKMKTYWVERNKVREQHISKIDYNALASGMKSMSLQLRKFTAKWACECIGTGKNMVRWKLRNEGYCPFCTEDPETTLHIMTCPHANAILPWTNKFNDFLAKLQKLDTCWFLLIAIKNELMAWRYDRPPDNFDYPPLLTTAILEQRQLGWNNFMEGLISPKWSMYMEQYYRKIKSKRSHKKWASKLVHQLCQLTFNIWEIRNKQLHDTAHINDMKGVPILESSIRKEWTQGLGRLPASEFSHLFKHKLDHILSQSNEWKMHWFFVVRQGRILMDPTHLIDDEFRTSIALQKWLNISYDVTDSEMKPLLLEAIRNEMSIGIGLLPPNLYTSYFNTTIQELTTHNKSINDLRHWLRDIRFGRIKFDKKHLLTDDFTHHGAAKGWLGM